MKGVSDMGNKNYIIPNPIVDAKENRCLEVLTEKYNKMIEPTFVNKAFKSIEENVPDKIKLAVNGIKDNITENELFVKSLEVLGKSFQTMEQYAAKLTMSEDDVISKVNALLPDNKIEVFDEICLVRGYDLAQLVNKSKVFDTIAAIVEGAATGAPGFAGIPFNLVLSTFLFYRAVQSVALFYGYDIKNDPAELEIASEVFMNALSPQSSANNELSNSIAKIMLLTTATSVKQTVKKGWTAMAEKGGVSLLLTQMRALANSAAKKALEKAGKAGLEKTAFSEVFEQIGKKLTQKVIGKSIPFIGAFVGATIDFAQMVNILKYAKIFYNKRFILEKESRINVLLGNVSDKIVVDCDDVIIK